MMSSWINKDPVAIKKWFRLAVIVAFGCQSEPPQALRRFGLVMMTAQMNEQMPFRNLKMVSIGSDAQRWVSDQPSSILEVVWCGHDDSMDEQDQTPLQSQNGFNLK